LRTGWDFILWRLRPSLPYHVRWWLRELPAAGTNLLAVDVSVNRGDVFLTDEDWEFVNEGGMGDGDGAPSSTSHLRF
jgi:hypothetical protein